MRWTSRVIALVALAGAGEPVEAGDVVQLRSVEVTFGGTQPDGVRSSIDGVESSPAGWIVDRQMWRSHSAIFATAEPIEADLITVTLFFLSGRPGSGFAKFALLATGDTEPTFDGAWEALPAVRYRAEETTLRRLAAGQFEVDAYRPLPVGTSKDDVYTITLRATGRRVTGFKLVLMPIARSELKTGWGMAWSANGASLLTEIRVEVEDQTTNVALYAPARASHKLHSNMVPEALTDGLPATFAHPETHGFGPVFYFEIDLGSVRDLDHIALRGRGDRRWLERFARIGVDLFETPPGPGVAPGWRGMARPQGGMPPNAALEVLRAEDGAGAFRGRYLRLWSDSEVRTCPQLAEVEVYERRTPRLAYFRADGDDLPLGGEIVVPPGALRLAAGLEVPSPGSPSHATYRWRLLGHSEAWHPERDWTLEIPSPPPGRYTFEVQAAHSDGVWDATLFAFPVRVLVPFTETWGFRVGAALGILMVGAGSVRWAARKRLNKLEAQTALNAERARIARDMHDDVGARLSRLALLQDVVSRDERLSRDLTERMASLAIAAREALRSLDEVVWTVNPKNDTLAAMAEFLAQYAVEYLEPAGISCRVESLVEWPAAEVRARERHELALAFKEAVQNVVKHSGATEVRVAMGLSGGAFRVVVADNGRGLPAATAGAGRDGFGNMRARLAALGGRFEASNGEGGGAVVAFEMPVRTEAP
jgi:signal transduction histidine kinase